MSPPALHLSGSATIGGVALFGPLQLEVPAGQWTCLLGASGVGKSTLLRLLAGLALGVRFDGTYGASDGVALPGRVALMAQSDLLLPWLECLGNVTLGARLRGQVPDLARAKALLAQVGLAEHLRRRPAQLSGGQRQRVALARTLMEDCPVILLDEPFSALDARTRAQMQELAARLLAGRTVLMVTHDPAEAARLGDQVLLMTAQGLAQVEVPAAPPPRAVDDGATLALQGRLLRALMEAA
jgi:putative hydroxymethylpyrimidine transport system ATP-binding protein